MNWDADPELKQLWLDFVKSLDERRVALDGAIAALARGDRVAARQVRDLAHKLGGAAASYGFERLTNVAGALDDWLEVEGDAVDLDRARRFAELLRDLLAHAVAHRSDERAGDGDARLAEVIAAGEMAARKLQG